MVLKTNDTIYVKQTSYKYYVYSWPDDSCPRLLCSLRSLGAEQNKQKL